MDVAIWGGDVLLADWILDNTNVSTQDLKWPTYDSNTEMLDWLYDHGCRDRADDLLVNVARCGNLDVAKWIHEKNLARCQAWGERNPTLLAATKGHLEVAKFLFSSGYGTCSEGAMMFAARFGHLETVKWLISEFGEDPGMDLFKKWPSYPTVIDVPVFAMDGAASKGHFDVLLYLQEVDTKIPKINGKRRRDGGRTKGTMAGKGVKCTKKAIEGAAQGGHLKIIKWLLGNRPDAKCTPRAMDLAALGGHLDVIKWLHEHRSEGCTAAAMDYASVQGHLAVMQWLHTNRVEGCTAAAMDRAAHWGHINVVKWLHVNRSEGCTVTAMNKAARAGNLASVKWLTTHRTEGCSTLASYSAAMMDHFDVLLFLYCHFPDKFVNVQNGV